jgi:transcriptional regulator with XRE-family HTH domain
VQSIGDRILEMRKELNISQKKLADKVGITEASLSRYENSLREPKAEIIGRIASALGVSVDYILGNTNVRNPQDYDLIKSLSSDDPELLEILKQFTKREDLKVILKQLLSVDKNEIKPLAKMISGLVSENKELELIINKNNMEADKKLEEYSKKPNYKIMKNEK